MFEARYLILFLAFWACGETTTEFYHSKDPTEVFFVREFGEKFSVEENSLGRFSVVGEGGVSEDFSVTKSPDRSLGHYGQNEEVIKVTSVKKADILWVVDNSGSMQSSQNKLSNNFSLFIEDFAEKDINFKMAIITTDSAIDKSGNKLNSSELKKNKQKFIDDFKTKIKVGTQGSHVEKAFEMTKKFLESYSSWNRSNALLAIIFVSDEKEGGNNATVRRPVKYYTEAIAKSKGGSLEGVRAFSVCKKGYCDRFEKISNDTNGLTRYLKDSFADMSKEFGESIVRTLVGLKTVFPLNINPLEPDKLSVEVNGTTVPRDTNESEGWNYDGITNAIEFFGSHVPPSKSRIKVYEEGDVDDTFCLSEQIDQTRVDSMLVEVAGQSVPRDTAEKNGWNYDGIGNCVEFFGGHAPSKGEKVNISFPGKVNNTLCLRNRPNAGHLDKIEVSVGGNPVPRDSAKSDGWEYDDQNNCIEFFGSHALSEGSTVKVSLGMKSHFCLQKGFDPGKLGEVEVEVGGKNIPRDTTGIKGWDYNRTSHCVELYGDHGLTSGLPVKISWGQTSKFCLDRPLDGSRLESVVIKVDGAEVERGGEGVGWDYDTDTNCISFFGDRKPDINSKIEITYTPDYR